MLRRRDQRLALVRARRALRHSVRHLRVRCPAAEALATGGPNLGHEQVPKLVLPEESVSTPAAPDRIDVPRIAKQSAIFQGQSLGICAFSIEISMNVGNHIAFRSTRALLSCPSVGS